jgi:D-amino-acid oxidase
MLVPESKLKMMPKLLMQTRRQFVSGLIHGLAASTFLERVRGEERSIYPECTMLPNWNIKASICSQRITSRLAGIRPFRKNGFNLEVETIGSKTIFHNYGHGGSGITMSWGTATYVVNKVQSMSIPKTNTLAVLGSGAVGLATASRLDTAGYKVKIYAKDAIMNSTSAVAGACVYPSLLIEPDKVTALFEKVCIDALGDSFHTFQSLLGKRYGIEWVPVFYSAEQRPTLSWEDLLALTIYPHPNRVTSAPMFRHSNMECTHSLIVNMPIYLAEMYRELMKRGIVFQKETILGIDDLERLDEKYIVNCMGVGASCLGRNDLTPIKGQAAIIDKLNTEHAFGIEERGFYLYPRRNSIVIGGGAYINESNKAYDLTMEKNMIARIRQALA